MYSNQDISKVIKTHFAFATHEQLQRFEILPTIYSDWNEKINVVSRKDIENIFERHILHSLAIAKVCHFKPNSEILDVGTGGGFPGIPLAILFPEVNFTLIDSIGKKIRVVNEVKDALGLKNVNAIQMRAEHISGHFDFIVSRAVTQMPEFVEWVRNKISKIEYHSLDNGILYLKGGDLTQELEPILQGKGKKPKIKIYDIYNYFPSDFFETKKVVYIKL
ncbi:MAG: 16S rRNA (guanine(527)-N(7))-methyltransferase RsmG [Bacteroidales bacterium]|jgi:16S rRNA (guanine527-N7)-methyltransferase|nr:16S rRNA (guanine(527)-N(7))-methyltransferase RsmG [Bacteroidales bacterium]MDD4704098.1 16S rRNA (guanine(527)-N(7))-methyltransferase RsmG [Bacteroidales bacterium]MDX9799117.1 16S rRNA (guanine(527)-N(7))-methyltransferase RsmG [Bacteroidales bacterium]